MSRPDQQTLKKLTGLVAEIQDLHKSKISLAKEIQSGQLELETLLIKREALLSSGGTRESQVNKQANELVLRLAKLFFSGSRQPAVPVNPPLSATAELLGLKEEAEMLLSRYYVQQTR